VLIINTGEVVIVGFSDVIAIIDNTKPGKWDTVYFKLPISKVPIKIYQFILLNRQSEWLWM